LFNGLKIQQTSICCEVWLVFCATVALLLSSCWTSS